MVLLQGGRTHEKWRGVSLAKVIETFYGKLISVVSKETNEEYVDDWRNEYLEWPGLIVVGESENKKPGKKFVYLYPNDPDNARQPYLHTSLGEYIREKQYVIIDTANSKYIFEEGDFGIEQRDKELLMLNVFFR